jgi:hypothetical protein
VVNIPVSFDWIPLLANVVLVVWMFATMNQRVRTLEMEIKEFKLRSDKMDGRLESLRDGMNGLAIVMARSDEKLVQLVRESSLQSYGNGHSTPPPRKKKVVDPS